MLACSKITYSSPCAGLTVTVRGHLGRSGPSVLRPGPRAGGRCWVVAEGLGDDGGGGLEDELAQGGGERGAGGDAELAGQRGHGGGVERLAGAAAGEQPPAGGVGGGVHVLPAGGQLEQQGGEWLGDGDGRV